MSELYVNLERRLTQAEAAPVNILTGLVGHGMESHTKGSKGIVSESVRINFDALIELYMDSNRSRTRQIIWEFVERNAQDWIERLKMRDVGINVLVH